ncbi:hypothetical protein H4219_004050 [Mycoemilia scoparia]|uniref:Calcium channel YVC1-like C-terminal transmembrane domain-containing protein n=1 Tax=Mycoemilia scoparia TaxID=417184 RepID=A0A9W7ZZH7_9FUNG|nr:hypothetical protein H4219_004050 [Mycoemilia scoparia]
MSSEETTRFLDDNNNDYDRIHNNYMSDVDAYDAIVEIYILLYQNVKVGLSMHQIHSPDTYINLIQPLKKQVRKVLAEHSGAALFSCLYVRGVNQALAEKKTRKADVFATRAIIAETLAICCAKELHSMKSQDQLRLAFCMRYVPFSRSTGVSVCATPISSYSARFAHYISKLQGGFGDIYSSRNFMGNVFSTGANIGTLGSKNSQPIQTGTKSVGTGLGSSNAGMTTTKGEELGNENSDRRRPLLSPRISSSTAIAAHSQEPADSIGEINNNANKNVVTNASGMQLGDPNNNGNNGSEDSEVGGIQKQSLLQIQPRVRKALATLHKEMAKTNEPEHTLEVAARTEAKRFTVQEPVNLMVNQLWKGRIRWKDYDIFQHSGSQNGHSSTNQDSYDPLNAGCETATTFNSHYELGTAISNIMPAGAHFTKLEIWLAQTLHPLRTPAFQCNVGTVHFAVFLVFYLLVLYTRSATMTLPESIFCVIGLSYIVDELRQVRENGMVVYTKNLWNSIDVFIYSIFSIYFVLRLKSLSTGDQDDIDRSYDILALNGIILWPRMFAVLDQFEFFGTLIIQLKYMLQSTGLFVVILIVVSLGFFQTFWLLSLRYSQEDTWVDISGMMFRIFFGNSYFGFDKAQSFGNIIGTVVMGMYIGISVLVLYNILIGVINQAYARILDNAQQEFRFAMMLKVLEYVTAHTTYPFIPPFNVVQLLILTPLKRSPVSSRVFVLARSLMLIVLYFPHLLVYSALHRIRYGVTEKRKRSVYYYDINTCEIRHSESEQSSISDIDESSDDDSDSSPVTPTGPLNDSALTPVQSSRVPTNSSIAAKIQSDPSATTTTVTNTFKNTHKRVDKKEKNTKFPDSDIDSFYQDHGEMQHQYQLVSGPNHRLVPILSKGSFGPSYEADYNPNSPPKRERSPKKPKSGLSPLNLFFSKSKGKSRSTDEHSIAPPSLFASSPPPYLQNDLNTIKEELQNMQTHQTSLDEKYEQLNNKLDTIIRHLSTKSLDNF